MSLANEMDSRTLKLLAPAFGLNRVCSQFLPELPEPIRTRFATDRLNCRKRIIAHIHNLREPLQITPLSMQGILHMARLLTNGGPDIDLVMRQERECACA